MGAFSRRILNSTSVGKEEAGKAAQRMGKKILIREKKEKNVHGLSYLNSRAKSGKREGKDSWGSGKRGDSEEENGSTQTMEIASKRRRRGILGKGVCHHVKRVKRGRGMRGAGWKGSGKQFYLKIGIEKITKWC